MENYQRMLQEMKAGMAKSWDVNYLAFDFYTEFLPYQKKFDILGMAQHGVLRMAPKLIDPDQPPCGSDPEQYSGCCLS